MVTYCIATAFSRKWAVQVTQAEVLLGYATSAGPRRITYRMRNIFYKCSLDASRSPRVYTVSKPIAMR